MYHADKNYTGPTDAFAIGPTACGESSRKKGFTCPWGTVEENAARRSKVETLEDLRVEEGQECHLLQRIDIYTTSGQVRVTA